ncbi:hypothetical protein [Kitasatospora phosalacinea]|uniref:Uncharacterized protein n=1 Tax=Kitasatospora phosalacinea TaxID=2065 RepID=A0ABW6GRA3_9ACTN
MDLKPFTRPTRYTISCLPAGISPDARLWDLHVEVDRDGYWSITDGHRYLDINGIWHDTRREGGQHTLGEAIATAEAAAPHVTINGLTPAAALARIVELEAAG